MLITTFARNLNSNKMKMKKIKTILLLCFLANTLAIGQNNDERLLGLDKDIEELIAK